MKKNIVRLDEKKFANLIRMMVNESIKRILKEDAVGNGIQDMCSLIKQIYNSVSLRYRMAEYEDVFKMAIENGYPKEDLIQAFKQCNLDCTTNPRSKARFDEIWNSLGGSNGDIGQMSEGISGLDDDEYLNEPEDDWRSEEPSEEDIMMAMKEIEQYCSEYKLRFRELGNGEFGVMCNVGSDADIQGFMNYIQHFIDEGMLNNLGIGTTDNGIWHAKFKILKCW